jgi:outer membrane protein OmpA-like peptidoglycan-associated protein
MKQTACSPHLKFYPPGIIVLFLFFIFPVSAQNLLQEKITDSIAVQFDHGGNDILNRSDLIARINKLQLTTNGYFVLKAYTDTTSTLEFNEKLAEQRLKSVQILLKGSKYGKLPVKTFNLNETRTAAMWQRVRGVDTLFRRVDILVYGDKPGIELNKPLNLKINFESGTAKILPASTGTLKELESILKKDTTLNIQLNGHVCCSPDQPLSLARARAVGHYLIVAGIPQERIFCYGFSNKKPLVAETTDENMAKNRRVEVIFVQRKSAVDANPKDPLKK